MNSPFLNDMFSIVWIAFKNLYPDKDCECQWVPEVGKDDNGDDCYGMTTFDGDGTVHVEISAQKLTVSDAVEVFAHELAHVAAGKYADHGKEWEEVFDRIFDEYNRIGYEMFDRQEKVGLFSEECSEKAAGVQEKEDD